MPNINKTKSAKISTWGKIWRISLAIAVPLGGGLIVSLFARDAMTKFGSFNQPPLSPPAILFSIVWTLLRGDRDEANKELQKYVDWYNDERPHRSIDYMTPNEYALYFNTRGDLKKSQMS